MNLCPQSIASAEMRAERDELRRQIGAGASKVMEIDQFRREVEQREAVSRATSKQLQDSLQRQMQESGVREERLREEAAEMRMRWQDAISSREQMASELSSATAPLLRQISSLQDQIRSKSDHWQSIESTLAERAMRAENAAEIADHKKNLMEEQLGGLKQQLSSLTTRHSELHAQFQAAELSLERLKRSEVLWNEAKADYDTRILMETNQKQSLLSALKELELRHKVELNDLVESSSLLSTQKDLENAKLRKALEQSANEISSLRSSQVESGGSGMGSASSLDNGKSGSLMRKNSGGISNGGNHGMKGAVGNGEGNSQQPQMHKLGHLSSTYSGSAL
jgi:hypothetical protein